MSGDGVHRLLGERGLADTWLTAADARAAFRDVARARRFDERAVALQRRGWMSGYPPHAGEEATGVGAVHAMRETDWLAPYYRSNAAQVARGVPMADLLAFRRGRHEFQSGADRRVLPQSIPVGSHLPHATGLAAASGYVHRRAGGAGADENGGGGGGGSDGRDRDEPADEPEAVLVHFGDGATSTGEFHEAVTLAGALDAPVVFCCQNNGWAISTPTSRQTAAPSIAAKADAYGIAGRRVDGNDPLAVREVVTDALAAAREGRPTLVEALTDRRGPHTTADDPGRYRDDDRTETLPAWRVADPLDRLAAFCRDEGVLDDDEVEAIRAAAAEEVDEAVATTEGLPDLEPEATFAHVHADADEPGAYPHLDRQRAALRAAIERSAPDGAGG